MVNQYLLDTNVVIEMLRGSDLIIRKIETIGIDNCCISELTIAELFYGAVKGNKKKNFDDISIVQRFFKIIPAFANFEKYAQIRNELRLKGKTGDHFDMLIAATSMNNGYTLVTQNTLPT